MAAHAVDPEAQHVTLREHTLGLGGGDHRGLQRLRQLEEQLGTALFQREGRQVRPTPQARRLLHSLQQAFELIGEACDELRDPGSQAQLRIAVTVELAQKWLVGRLADFAERHPQITLHLHEQPLEASLPGAEIDLAITYGTGPEDASAYFVRPLPTLQFFPVCSPGLFNQLPLKHPRDLARHCLLHDDQDGKTWTAWLTTHAGDIQPARHLYLGHAGLTMEAAARGQGVAIGDNLTSAEDLASGMEKLLIDEKPDLVVWQSGTIDAMRRIEPDDFRTALEQGVETLQKGGADVILMNMQYSPRTDIMVALGPYADNMRFVAQQHEIPLFDRLAIMRHWSDTGAFDLYAALVLELLTRSRSQASGGSSGTPGGTRLRPGLGLAARGQVQVVGPLGAFVTAGLTGFVSGVRYVSEGPETQVLFRPHRLPWHLGFGLSVAWR